MPFTPELNKDVASAIISQIGSQCDMINSLAVAVCAGTLALLFSIVQHNYAEGGARDIVMRWKNPALGALLLECLSLLFGYLLRSSLVSLMPVLYGQKFDGTTLFMNMKFEGSGELRLLAGTQFLLFFGGVLLLTIVFFINIRKLLSSK